MDEPAGGGDDLCVCVCVCVCVRLQPTMSFNLFANKDEVRFYYSVVPRFPRRSESLIANIVAHQDNKIELCKKTYQFARLIANVVAHQYNKSEHCKRLLSVFTNWQLDREANIVYIKYFDASICHCKESPLEVRASTVHKVIRSHSPNSPPL